MAKTRYLSSIRLLLNNDLSNKALLNGLLLTSALLLSGAAMATEEPKYTVLKQTEDFELRRYDEQLVAQTWVTGDQDAASRAGFKILADYIFGNNSAANGESRKISMTAPDSIQQTEDKWRVQFTMPSQYTLQTLPKPNNPNIEIVEVPAQTYGVIKFSGLAGTEKVAAKTKELQSWMQGQNLTITGKPELARYNPPWTLPFMRRNEIIPNPKYIVSSTYDYTNT